MITTNSTASLSQAVGMSALEAFPARMVPPGLAVAFDVRYASQ
jgi:hypothetical protein